MAALRVAVLLALLSSAVAQAGEPADAAAKMSMTTTGSAPIAFKVNRKGKGKGTGGENSTPQLAAPTGGKGKGKGKGKGLLAHPVVQRHKKPLAPLAHHLHHSMHHFAHHKAHALLESGKAMQSRGPSTGPSIGPQAPTPAPACVARHKFTIPWNAMGNVVQSDATTCDAANVGGAWDLVRRTAGKTYPDQDQLKGTAARGAEHNDPLGAPFAKAFKDLDYDQFLFANGDCSKWMIMDRNALIGGGGTKWFNNKKKPIVASHQSSDPYEAKMTRRQNKQEDPQVTFTDIQGGNNKQCNMLYIEKSQNPSCNNHPGLQGGLNVFMRKASQDVKPLSFINKAKCCAIDNRNVLEDTSAPR